MTFRFPFFTSKMGALALIALFTFTDSALAACSGPQGNEGDIIYNSTHKSMQYCDNTNWIAMGGRAGLSSPSNNVPTSNMIGHWALDEGAGTTTADETGSNTGSLTFMDPGTDWIAGQVGSYALDFDGADDYVNLGASPELDISDNTATVAAWVNRGAGNNVGIIFHKGNSGSNGYTLGIGTGPCASLNAIKATKFGVADICINSYPTGGVWHHLAVVYDTTGVEAFVDGVSVGTHASTANIASTGSGALIGSNDDFDLHFDGQIDDVRVYDRALSDAEIQALYLGTGGVDACAAGQTPAPGTPCLDDTVYAGEHDGNRLFAARCDSGQTWDGAACNGARTSFPWNNGNNTDYVETFIVDKDDGLANTNSLITIDSDSGDGLPISPHQAALECSTASYHDLTDWYLPAENELGVLYDNYVAIGNFSPGTRYWSSTEKDDNAAFATIFSDGTPSSIAKHQNRTFRCIRREVLGECSNPNGDEGDIIYNSSDEVMQYCADTTWVAMGPVPGAGGGGCLNPVGDAGTLTYNTNDDVMQYCDGASWISIGKVAPVPPDTTPDAIVFPDAFTPYCVGEPAVSTAQQVTGINTPATVTISGGTAANKEFQICSGTPCTGGNIVTPFGSVDSTISNGQYIMLRNDNPGMGGPVTFSITIGTETYIWTSPAGVSVPC